MESKVSKIYDLSKIINALHSHLKKFKHREECDKAFIKRQIFEIQRHIANKTLPAKDIHAMYQKWLNREAKNNTNSQHEKELEKRRATLYKLAQSTKAKLPIARCLFNENNIMLADQYKALDDTKNAKLTILSAYQIAQQRYNTHLNIRDKLTRIIASLEWYMRNYTDPNQMRPHEQTVNSIKSINNEVIDINLKLLTYSQNTNMIIESLAGNSNKSNI